MGLTLNRSMCPEDARRMRGHLLSSGYVEAKGEDHMRQLEAQGKLAFFDRTCGGAESFSDEEMEEFRRTPPEQFPAHQRKWDARRALEKAQRASAREGAS